MNTCVYKVFEKTDVSWYCCQCGLPNFNSSLLKDTEEASMENSCTRHTVTPITLFPGLGI